MAMGLAAYPVAYQDYNNYVMHMISLGKLYDWDSVMKLDEEFRRAQAISYLRWCPPSYEMSISSSLDQQTTPSRQQVHRNHWRRSRSRHAFSGTGPPANARSERTASLPTVA